MKKRPTIDELVAHWRMQPMDTENVMFSQSYVGEASTAIIAMLTDDPQSFSDMHRLPADEIWHFYLGDAIELLLLEPNGKDEVIILGQDVMNGEQVQYVVPAGVWMGARIRPGGTYAVFGNTMAPGFSLDDFEAAVAADLVAQWPQHKKLIRALTQLE
jgi:predicted cupin superfamily sugar epimerase